MRLAEAKLGEDLHRVADRIWTAMLRRPLTLAPDLGDTQPLEAFGERMYTAWCSLTGADWSGSVHLHCSEVAARAFTSWCLNDTTELLRQGDLSDCLGELSNVLCGNFKSALPTVLRVGLPAVVVGESYSVQLPGGREVVRVACVAEEHRIDFVLFEQERS